MILQLLTAESALMGPTGSAKKNRVVGRTDGGKIMFCNNSYMKHAEHSTNHKKIHK